MVFINGFQQLGALKRSFFAYCSLLPHDIK